MVSLRKEFDRKWSKIWVGRIEAIGMRACVRVLLKQSRPHGWPSLINFRKVKRIDNWDIMLQRWKEQIKMNYLLGHCPRFGKTICTATCLIHYDYHTNSLTLALSLHPHGLELLSPNQTSQYVITCNTFSSPFIYLY